MSPSSQAFDIIREHEGLRLKAYLCPAGVATIGYGSTGPDIRLGMVWTIDQAKARLEGDVTRFAKGVAALIGDARTTQAQFDACVSLAYNIGLAAFARSSVLALHRLGLFDRAAKAFALWNKGGGKILAGLVAIRAHEAALYLHK